MRRSAPPSVPRSGEPRLRPLAAVIRLPRRSPLYLQLARTLAAADALHGLRTDLGTVPVRLTATTRQSGCYRMREGDPIDLRISRRPERLALSLLHELGHLVDHQLGHELGPSWASGRHDAFAEWREASARLPSRLPAGVGRARRRYFESAKEVWARSYAQTVLTHGADPWLQGHLTGLLDLDDVFVWPMAEFEPVAAEVGATLARLGLLRAPVAGLAAA
jgi:hypothetical protein